MNALQKKQRRSSIFRQSPTNNSRECDNHHHGFLFHWAFSARLPGDVESRPRGTPSRSRRHTFGHEYPRVRRTHLGNSIATTTGSSIRYSVATLATYTLETITYVQAIPLGSGAVVTKAKPKKRVHSSSVARSESPYAPISYAMFKDEDTRDHSLRCMRSRAMRQGYRL